MSANNEQLKPTPFDVAPTATPDSAPKTTTPSWMLPALGGLLLLAAIVVFWLPSAITPTAPEPLPTQETPAGTATSGPAPADTSGDPAPSPWSDAQDAKLRKAAQDVLAELLDIQFELEERGVAQWAGEEFAAANATALEGDELYRQREYEQATARYQQGLEQLQAINNGIGERVDALLAQTEEALQTGTADDVDTALALATLIEPENAALPVLAQRAANYPELLQQLATAAEAEANGDLALAQASLSQANNLDAAHLRAEAELARVTEAFTTEQFNAAMSEGYAALDSAKFKRARDRFRQAAQLRPGSSEASSALQELAGAEQSASLVQLQRDGARFEANENWQQALASYQRALGIDSNVSYASEGASRAAARAELDKQLSAVIDAPERLADIAVARDSAVLLEDARAATPQGPVLEQQIATLDKLLRLANTEVDVTLTSDGETEVIVYKVARLGKFQQQQLTLRPGTYTIRGSRNGFRDVLEKITITPDGPEGTILIACQEPIL
ncbi:hypothetical protein [Halioglobus japonicus]|uniref:hypothetical protein n=1 Tax=Halioglobus japonicus TaxID=930805 RepID=UPI0011AFA87F|nr:hypothetical protein [Halioglobus japonicus]